MKPKFLLKGAVVAMAAFGAFAFNGNTQNDLRPFKVREGTTCTNILAECSQDNTGPYCKISLNGVPTDVFDLDCTTLIHHEDSNPVYWEPINP